MAKTFRDFLNYNPYPTNNQDSIESIIDRYEKEIKRIEAQYNKEKKSLEQAFEKRFKGAINEVMLNYEKELAKKQLIVNTLTFSLACAICLIFYILKNG